MNNNPTRLECLANETFFEILEYLDGQDIYRAFENLNSRFNGLLRSVHQLSITLSPDINNLDFSHLTFLYLVRNLIVNENANVVLGYFPNVRRLILHWLPPNVLDKLACDVLPELEYLSIDSRISSTICTIYGIADQIFTNGLPQLKFCLLPNMSVKPPKTPWTQTSSINVLKIGEMDLHVYPAILSSCPNLRVFEFGVGRMANLPIDDVKHHLNIRTLVIKQVRSNTQVMNMCLPWVPNVQRLDIHFSKCHELPLVVWSNFSWFKPSIDLYLSKLHRLNYYLSGILNPAKDRLERYFHRIQNDRYQARLLIEEKDATDQMSLDD